MQVEFTKKILKVLSNERLSTYPQGDRLKLVSNYVWNMVLSESLYPTLQTLEVVLRNAIHNSARNYFRNDYWFDDQNIISHRNAIHDLQIAKRRLTEEGKLHEAQRIIAVLTFGFWNNLFNNCYEQTLWRPLIKDIFPHMPKRIRTRKYLSPRIHESRLLRNRVFHHEPIWHWQNLAQQHDQILEIISWVEPMMYELVILIDEFPSVYHHGLTAVEQQLKKFSTTKCFDMIRETAYFLAEQHNFEGDPHQYWLAAERQIIQQYFW